jgi:hypothetical protein
MPDRMEVDADPRIITEDGEIVAEHEADLADEEEQERWARETPAQAGLPPDDDPEPDFATADYQKLRQRNFIIQREGKDFVLYAGLLDLLHQVSRGHFEIKTKLEQVPGTENAQTAIVSAVVSILDPEDHITPIRTSSGIGDAYPGNVSKVMAPHSIRMAETRGIARALRSLLNVGMAAAEELGGGPGASQASAPAEPAKPTRQQVQQAGADKIQVDGTWFTRAQVWQAYQNRMGQAREANMTLSRDMLLTNKSPLQALVAVTQTIKRKLAETGKLPPAGNGR